MLQSFWGYIASIQNDLASNHPEIKQVIVKIISEDAPQESIGSQKASDDAPKKSYWRMLLRLFIADFAATLLFSFLIVILVLPLAPLGLLADKIGSGISMILSLPFIIIAGVGQVYFWILWAAFCTFTVKYYIDSPTVTQRWLYYLTAFIAVTAPLGWLGHKESEAASSNEERRNTERGTMYYSFIAIIAFIVFCIWATLLDFKYISWLNHWLY